MALNEKTRRHSGRVTPRLTVKGPQSEIIDGCLEPQIFWDDWKNYRDGQRGSRDRKLFRSEYAGSAKYFEVKKWNEKLTKLIEHRKVKKSV